MDSPCGRNQYGGRVQTSHNEPEYDIFPPRLSLLLELQPDNVIEHRVARRPAGNFDIDEPTLICAAWALVTSLMTNADDVVFGVMTSSVADSMEGVKKTSSPRSTPAPMLVRTERNQTVLELLRSTGPGDMTFTSPRASQDGSLFQTLLVFEAPAEPSNHRDSNPYGSDKHALVLSIRLLAEELTFKASFDARVLTPWIVQRLLDRLTFVTQQLVEIDPLSRLSELDMMTSQDIAQIWRWNSVVPPPTARCVHDIIRDRVRSQPDAPAVHAWDGQLTYSKLDELSTRLATKLVKIGVTPDRNPIVPLCFEKSMWTTVALIGVLKAGGAFLLLDPSVPEKRLQYMVRHVKAKIMVCGRSTQSLGLSLVEDVIAIDDEFFAGSERSVQQLLEQQSSSLMYVVFTSGSTGVPKCVKASHSNVASALHYQLESLAFTESSRVFDFASYSFTTAICNVTFALAAGGCLCVPSEQDRRDKLSEMIVSLQANLLDITPSVARTLVPEEVPSLQTLIFGGETLLLKDVERWKGRKVYHLYGQSECTSNSTINHLATTPEAALHIGWGAGLNTWIVDANDHNILLPPGCIGELLLAGPLVTPGYLVDDSNRVSAAFIDDPPWLSRRLPPDQLGRKGRLYKTGDLVSYREDGSLNIFGRKDTQVKIRGQRVEMGEVEHWVQTCVREASQVAAEVIVPKGEESSRTLVCFLQVLPTDEDAPETGFSRRMGAKLFQIPSSVEQMLSGNLPRYMVPTAFFSLQRLPVTTTGKIDRKTLRSIGGSFSVDEMAQMRTIGQGPKEQPSSRTEQLLQMVWGKVLGVQQSNIGLDDSFFHLGGDSIAAMKVVGEARKLRISVAVADLFRHPTLRGFAKSGGVAEKPEEQIRPFALANHGKNVNLFVRDIALTYNFDAAKIQDAYPCTALQEGLMSLSAKRTGDYIMQEVLILASSVSIKGLRAAWEQVAQTKSILRTRIVQHHELGFMQVVLDDEFCWTDTTGLDRYLESDREQPMGLGEPLTRFALVRDNAGEHDRFVLTIHHAICDGWSMRLIIEDFYRALRGLKTEPGPQFQAFVKYTIDQDKGRMQRYWKNGLDAYSSISFPGVPLTVNEPAVHQVIEYAFTKPCQKFKDITASTLARAAWALVVGRMTNSDDVVFGVTVSGRNAPVAGIEEMTAPTFATVPLRVKLRGHESVSNYLQSLQGQAVEMIPYEQAGLHNIAKLSPDCQMACRFQSLLVFQPETERIDKSVGEWQSAEQQQRWFNPYALMLEIRPTEDKILISASFDARMLGPWIVRKMLVRLETLMRKLDCEGEKAVEEVDSMITEDLQQIWEWNKTLPPPTEKLIHEVIQDRALARPTVQAVCAWDGQLTYQQLNSMASRLAGLLIDLGVKPDALVPLCFEKSMWTPVAMLGVLKAGGGFVLLDPALPRQRLQTIVNQLGTKFILSSSTNLDLCAQLRGEVIEVGPKSIPTNTVLTTVAQSPSTAMFAVFTSGSTGTPKGIVLSHSNFLSGLMHQYKLLGFKPDSRVFDFAAYSFDIAVHNAFAAFVVGECLCIPADSDRHDAERISTAMADMRVTVADLTPSVARLIEPSAVPRLETLILAGEPVSVEDILPWWGKVQVINAYGPAECNISTINWQPSKPQDVTIIGKGVGAVTWIVDPENHDRLLPPGCIGELILEGPIVGRGYLGDSAKTTRSFIESPSWLVEGAQRQTERHGICGRLYKTGDLVRHLEDGSLAFVGRKDFQVKINGQRVELGEIEFWVRQMMNAEHAVAEIIDLPGEDKKSLLAAFLQIRGGALEGIEGANAVSLLPVPVDVEDKLSEHLPAHMRPNLYLEMGKFPMTPTGKTDRRRLRDIGSSFATSQTARLQNDVKENDKRQPRSDAELQMRTMWAKVLGIAENQIGADDNFIRLGGDSISIMRLVSMARTRGFQLSARDVLLRPRLEHVAKLLTTSIGDTPDSIPKTRETRFVEQSFAQEQLWNLHQLNPAFNWVLMPWVTRIRGELHLEALTAALHALESRHEILRTTFDLGTQSVQDLHRKELNVVDLSSEQDSSLAHVLRQDRTTRFDLRNQPGWRAVVYRLHEKEYVLSVTMHHIVSDGWSLGILHRELSTLYSAAIHDLNDPIAHIATPTIQYRDYSVWQRRRGQEAAHQQQLSFWTNHLAYSQAAEFPCDKPRPSILSGETDTEEIKIEGALYDQVQKFREEQGVTLFIVLIAAFRATHSLITGVSDATIGTASANRNRPETQHMIGHLVDVQCFRIQTKQESFTDLVHHVQAEAVAAVANQDVSFDQIISEKYPDANNDLSRHPLVQVIFAVHAQSSAEGVRFSLEGLETELMTSPIMSRFDIEFHVYQEKGCLTGVLVFSKDLYRPETARRILSEFVRLLDTSLAQPQVART